MFLSKNILMQILYGKTNCYDANSTGRFNEYAAVNVRYTEGRISSRLLWRENVFADQFNVGKFYTLPLVSLVFFRVVFGNPGLSTN
jgi:hypothetical protein